MAEFEEICDSFNNQESLNKFLNFTEKLITNCENKQNNYEYLIKLLKESKGLNIDQLDNLSIIRNYITCKKFMDLSMCIYNIRLDKKSLNKIIINNKILYFIVYNHKNTYELYITDLEECIYGGIDHIFIKTYKADKTSYKFTGNYNGINVWGYIYLCVEDQNRCNIELYHFI